MQRVSENWKNAHKQTLLNESFVEVYLWVTDPDALAVASPADNGAIYISNSSGLTDEVEERRTPYGTLEQNLWILDGDRKVIPENVPDEDKEDCYIGESLSDDKCVFSDRLPVITINFGTVFTKPLPGVTITWSNTYGECADTFYVKVYNGDTLKAEKEVMGNRSVLTFVPINIVDYDRIELIITKWCLPNRRARIEEIFIGLKKTYDKTSLFNYSHAISVHPISLALPKSEIRFSIDNVSGEYDPQNPSGISKYLTERSEVKTRYGLKMNDGSIEWINGGTFYLSEWYAKQNGMTADFVAKDLLCFLTDIYREDVKEIKSRTFYDLAEMLFQAANLPLNRDGSVKWVIDESLKSITTTAPLPEDTIANILQLIANATCCKLYQDRGGVFHIEPFKFSWLPSTWEIPEYEITSFNSYSKPEITLANAVDTIIVKKYIYTLDENGVQSDTQEFRYMMMEGRDTITVDNPLVTDNGHKIALWMYNYYLRCRRTLDFSWRGDVRLDALDFISNVHSFDKDRVLMTDIGYKYNGAFRATGKGKVIKDV